ncbi:MAG: toxin-antitoxin system YwqK family antitoxin [Planctomycetota bacterium]
MNFVNQTTPQAGVARLRDRLTACAAFGVVAVSASVAAAQPRDGEELKIERYTGPAIFLPEPDAPPPPRAVETRTDSSKYDDGTPRIERTVTRYSDDSFVSNGSFREYYQSGQLFVAGEFSAGLPAGEWTYYHATGEVSKKVTFERGQPSGVVTVLRADGTVAARRQFAAGKRTGVWRVYSEDGERVVQEQPYVDGKLDGAFKVWYDDGTLHRELNYKAGLRDGVSAEWDESGKKVAEVNFKAGLRDGSSIRWSPKGDKTERQYKGGKVVR